VTRFVVYLRVSTLRQGASGLGIEAQREAVARHVASTDGRIVAEVVETESGKQQAEHPAPTAPCPGDLPRSPGDLADREARSAGPQRPLHLRADGDRRPLRGGRHAERQPVHAARLRGHGEGGGIAIGARTKAALAVAKARGVKSGNPHLLPGSPGQARMAGAAKSAKATARAVDLLPVIAEVRAAGIATLSGIAEALTAGGVPTPSGRGAWSAATVMRLDRRVPDWD
jgi:hypothetical protein